MKNRIINYKKIVIIEIFVLILLAIAIPSATSINKPDRPFEEKIQNIWYVDDDNNVPPWDGSINNPYQYIQDGIDAANPNDEIRVFEGMYNENIIIDKEDLTLIGGWDQSGTSTINGGGVGDTVYIYHDGTIITEFTITNAAHGGIFINSADNILIENNIIIENTVGVWPYRSNENEIVGNTVTQSFEVGIYLDESNDNIIRDNFIINNYQGLWIISSSSNNLIYNNYFDNTDNAYDDGTNNQWNIDVTYYPSGNIIGGNFLGGNWWSDFLYWNNPYIYPGGSGVVINPNHVQPIPGTAGAIDYHPVPGFGLLIVTSALAIAIIFYKKIK